MTPRQAERAARSLFFRRRIMEDLPEIQSSLLLYLHDREAAEAVLGNFRLSVADGHLEVDLLPTVDRRQTTFSGVFDEVDAVSA